MKRLAACTLLIVAMAIIALTLAHYPDQADGPSPENPLLAREDYKSFFGADYYGIRDFAAATPDAEQAPSWGDNSEQVADFVRRYGLENARVLEVGAGPGRLQDAVAD